MKTRAATVIVLFACVMFVGIADVLWKRDPPLPAIAAAAYTDDVATLARARPLPSSASRLPALQENQPSTPMPSHTAKSVLLVDIETDRILGQEGGSTVLPLASLTKLVTVMTFLELELPHDQPVTIAPSDVVDVRSGLTPGDRVTVKDLIGLTLVSSSNSAAKALQRISGLSAEYFVGRMNMLGRRIGVSHATFVEPTGLNPKNAGAAFDVYRILMAASRNETIRSFANAPWYEFWNGKEFKRIAATDALITGEIPFHGKELITAKTGYLPEAGFHVAILARDSTGARRVVIVLGAADTLSRFTEADALLTWGTQ